MRRLFCRFGWIPVIRARQDVFYRELLCFVIAQLARPGNATGWIGAGAGVFVFDVARRLVVLVAAPFAPSFGLDVRADLATDKRRRGAFFPGPAKVPLGVIAGQFA